MFKILLIFLQICLAYSEYPYCFRFTWIGPFQDKEHIGGMRCEDLREDFKNVPCRQPLVTTDNDAVPDTIDLWRTYQQRPNLIGCPMTPGETCVKFTYTYNKGVQNITYMCAKVNATNGCYRQKFISGLETEVCVCESELGGMPCNYGISTQQLNMFNLFLCYSVAVLMWNIMCQLYSKFV